jgi:hypothetical protein
MVEEAHGFRRAGEAYVSYKNEADKDICNGNHDWDKERACRGRAYLLMDCKRCGAKYEYDASD